MSKLGRHTFIFSSATFISRILGLVRDQCFAYFFGVSGIVSVFNIATRIPSTLRQIFADGAVSSAFIPIYTRKNEREKQLFLSTSVWLVIIATLLLYIPVFFFPQFFVMIFGSGLNKKNLELASYLLRITFPFITFVSVWAIMAASLNTKDKFFMGAFTPTLSNLSVIIFIFIAPMFNPPIVGPAVGFVLGIIAQLIVIYFAFKKAGFKITYEFESKYIREIGRLLGPATIAASVSMLSQVVDTTIATWINEKAVAVIDYSLRLYQLPLAIFAISVANSLLPKINKANSENNHTEYQSYLRQAIDMVLFLIIPSAAGLILFSQPLISLFYQHGKFTSHDTQIVAMTMSAYALGLPFYSLHSIFVKTYHSKMNTKYPMRVAMIMLGCNAVLDIIFSRFLGPTGIALASSLCGLIGVSLTGKEAFKLMKKEDAVEIIKITIAALCMAVVLPMPKIINKDITCIIQLIIATIVFFVIAYFLKVRTLRKFKKA